MRDRVDGDLGASPCGGGRGLTAEVGEKRIRRGEHGDGVDGRGKTKFGE